MQLARSGIPVWYDQWSISIRLDEIDKRNADEQLLENIRDQMGRCSAVVQLMTPGFGESHWTRLEKQWAADQLTYRISSESELAVLLQRLRESRTEKPSRSRSPKNRRHLP
jgi:regulation of enolase protein 1 (concanavalin A-like superfamily)